MSINKRYRWMELDNKGRLKTPSNHYNSKLGEFIDAPTEYGSIEEAERKLAEFLGRIPWSMGDFVLVTVYSKVN